MTAPDARSSSAYRTTALVLAATFAAVGLLFFVSPGTVTWCFEQASGRLGLRGLPAGDASSGLFRVLAAAYMYLVAWLAWMMSRQPDEAVWPTVLAQAKFASAGFSLVLAIVLGPSLVIVTNAIVDGLLGLLALRLRRAAAGRHRAQAEMR